MAGLGAVPWCGPSWLLATILFAVGACSGAMYPLGLALLAERTSEPGLPRAYAWYMAMECVGSQFGAAAMGQSRDWWGEAAMFPVGVAALALVLAVWLGSRVKMRQRQEVVDAITRRAA
jgi:MFS family permease